MVAQEVRIQNRLGLHARAAALFVKTAAGYQSEVTLEKDGIEVNGKSIMGLMMLAAGKGHEVVVRAKGPDEGEAVEVMVRLITDKFHEEA